MSENFDIRKDIGWMTFVYPDESKKVIRTTMNNEILSSVKGGIKAGKLFDLDKLKWIDLPSVEGVRVEVTKEKPILSEVDEFVNRFI